ncbi:hypothetical protein [Streptomyces iconiensis]|uniref:Class I SAM-dependent methyltransferase n=1 Tax=Streptomyces iconiensis TaxID=1384038 RepID=A0ABT6ZZL8_9ACTN|nr:hypothetical protein [Streptomyces iconiensis]MDJ1134522.1 hypothetical protein [Streptomyces iconiensis]
MSPAPTGGRYRCCAYGSTPSALTAATGFDTRARTTAYTSPDDGPSGIPLLLVEIHPDTVIDFSPSPPAALLEPLPGPQAAWPGFFHRAHRLLPPEGILLVATRQHRDEHGLYDPLGELTACARSAGFLYLQHIIIAHTHPDADHLTPPHAARADGLPTGLAHSDLVLFFPRA